MMATTSTSDKPKNIAEYIASFPAETQEALQLVRATIHKSIPGLEETISYAIPAFKHSQKNLVYFAGYKNHVGMYPVPTDNPLFEKEFVAYKTSGKGAIQFPLTTPLPTRLIAKIVKHMLEAHLERTKRKR